jgi:CheY-like chemotaxis protein
MKDDSSHPPLSPLLQSGKGADLGGANAACQNGNPKSVEADERNVTARTLAHELRNVVAPIRNAVQLLRFRGGADPDLAPITDIIERQVGKIARLVDLLDDADRSRRGDVNSAGDGIRRETPSSAAAMNGRHILIVDDNAALLTSLSGVLREAGHEVKTATDGAEALALAQSWKPEFVLVDVHMPRMNGFEVAKQLRLLFPQRDVKLVMMSGSSLDETTLRGAERAGFDHCIDKIHDLATLERLLRHTA